MIRNFVIATTAAALLAGTASADTLRQALVSAYQTNPTLMGQRENLKGTDANVAIAKAAGRPQLSATAGLNRDLSRSGILKTPGGNGAQFSLGADLSVPVYSGGRVRNSIEASKIRVEAGRATLRAVEGDVFTQAVSAYMRSDGPSYEESAKRAVEIARGATASPEEVDALNLVPEEYRGLDRYDARKAVVADIDAEGLMVTVEDKLIMCLRIGNRWNQPPPTDRGRKSSRNGWTRSSKSGAAIRRGSWITSLNALIGQASRRLPLCSWLTFRGAGCSIPPSATCLPPPPTNIRASPPQVPELSASRTRARSGSQASLAIPKRRPER